MIELAGVRLERPRAAAPLLADVDLTVHRGDVVLITGGAGTGTSTLLAALVGDVTPAEGTVALFGRDLARLRLSSLLALRRRLGVVPQDLQLLPECTALANVELPLEIDHVPRRDAGVRAAAALGRLGLSGEENNPVAEPLPRCSPPSSPPPPPTPRSPSCPTAPASGSRSPAPWSGPRP
jgi:putative ABC transport system ATP-binding protein